MIALRLLAVALLAISASATAVSEPAATTFQWPAQLGPEIGVVRASWALFLIPRDAETALNASFPDGVDVTEHAKHFYGEVHGPYGGSTGGVREETSSQSLGPTEARLGPSATWSSLYVAGPDLRISTAGMSGQVIRKAPGACLDELPVDFGDRYNYDRVSRWSEFCPSGVDAVVAVLSDVNLTRGAIEFTVNAPEADVLEWHGTAVTCTTNGCPSGGQRTSHATPLPTGHELSNHDFTFVNLDPKGTAGLAGRGQAAFVLVGGASIDLAVNGWLRFPAAGLESCPSCEAVDGSTLQVTGTVGLLNLHPEGERRMKAQLVGHATSARLDEVEIHPAALGLKVAGGAAAAGAVAVALAILAKWLFASFFTRHKEEGPLENERRRRLYDCIVEHPGIHTREALRRADVPPGSGRYHVGMLARAGLILERRHRNSVCLFPNEPRFASSWHELAVLREPEYRLLHDWIQANPEKTQQEIVAAFAASHGWVRSTAQMRLRRLHDEGLVQLRHLGRYKLYSTTRPLVVLAGGQQALAGPAFA